MNCYKKSAAVAVESEWTVSTAPQTNTTTQNKNENSIQKNNENSIQKIKKPKTEKQLWKIGEWGAQVEMMYKFVHTVSRIWRKL